MRRIWISLFALFIIALALGPAIFAQRNEGGEKLVIVSPHWDGIRYEFARAFEAEYFEKTQRQIHVEYLDLGGGTSEIRKYVYERYKQAGPEKGIGVDVLFGGGMDILPDMAKNNFFAPVKLPESIVQEIDPSLYGQELRDKDNRYFAACLSGFGFVYNKRVVERAKLPVPGTWQDLGKPEFYGWISCGDPSSGSLHMAFELILQGEGWMKGEQTLLHMLSNAPAFNEGGSSVPRDVSLGQAAVGPCIDFYASAPIRRQGATHLQLVIPAAEGVVTPDCIAAMRGAPNKAAAEAFVTFVLSEKGQRIWYQERGTDGGPKDYDLERLPVMKKIYDLPVKTHTIAKPFNSRPAFDYDSKKGGTRWSMLNDLWTATVLNVHEELRAARKTAIEAGRDEDLGSLLCTAPLSEESVMKLCRKSMTPDAKNALRNKWSAWARRWYGSIERAAREHRAAPQFVSAPEE